MKASRRLRTLSVMLLTAFILIPAFQTPSSTAESGLSLTYEYDFSEPCVNVDASERLYAVPGLELDARGGTPALPFSSIYLAVPPGYSLSKIEVICGSTRTIEFIEKYPENPAELSLDDKVSFSYDYQACPYSITQNLMLEGVEVVGLDLRPLCWNRDSGALTFVSHFTVELSYEPGSIDFIGDLDRVRDLVDNPQVVPDLPGHTSSDVLPTGEFNHLIITSQILSAPFQALAEWKGERNELGSVHPDIRSAVVSLDYILGNSHFWGDPLTHGRTGNDTQTIIRNFLIAAHQEWGVQYVLLGGDDDVLPVRLLDSPMHDTDYDVLPGDIYYSGLDGNWDSDGDGTYGEVTGALGKDEADLLAEIFVGRATVSTVQQAWNFVNKTIAYEQGYSAQYGDDILLIGERLDDEPTYGDDYKEEVWDEVLADEGLERSTLYERDGTFSGNAVLAAMGSDVHVINHMGHGNFNYLAELVNYNVRGLENELPFIFYTQACMVAGFDEKSYSPGDCIAEEFVQGEGGTVAFIGNSRYGWYAPGSTAGSSQKFDLSFFSQVYDDGVTDLGRTLSYSKEEWAISAASAGTVRWVYLELNLLGDPETRVHLPGREVHDLAVHSVEIDRAILSEACPVSVRVQNQGQSDDVGTLKLLVNGTEVGSAPVSLSPGESVVVPMSWTPVEMRVTEIAAQLICAQDQNSVNDREAIRAMVDRRVTADETWTSDRTLTGGLLIDPLATVDIIGCNITLQPADLPYRFTVIGSLSLNGTSVQGSPFFIDSVEGAVEVANTRLVDLSTINACTLSDGSLVLRDAVIEGGAGWRTDGASVLVRNATLIDQVGEWMFSNSTADLELLIGQRGDGVRLRNMTGSIAESSWTGGSSGLSIDRCVGLIMHDLSFIGNGMDMGVSGDVRAQFEHDVEDVELTSGPLRILRDLDGATVENATGSLYLVGCQDMVVRSSRFGRSGNGLALIDSTGMEIVGNVFENCSVGVLAIDSDGIAWGNDLLFNDRQAVLLRSNLTFGKDYPVGGNHWSDMSGNDVKNGIGQDLAGADGIFDMAYDIDSVYDHYPKVAICSLVLDQLDASFLVDIPQADRLDQVTFTSTSSSGIGISNWTWDLGDGSHAYGAKVTHSYSDLGWMTIRLTVTDHFGSIDIAEGEVQVVNLGPECDFSISPEGPAPGETVRFQDLTNDPDGTVVSWYWDFGDGGNSSSPSPEHVYVNEGDYLVSLTVRDSDGALGNEEKLLAVGNDPPIPAFTWNPASVTTLTDVQFASSSSDSDGEVVSWAWNFGDGTFGNGQIVRHRYSSLGKFTVTLTVTDEDGATASLSKDLAVINSRPVASFTSPIEVESLLDAQFIDRSYDLDGIITSWSWNFGDGESSGERSPWHAYLRPGTYTVELVVTDNKNWTGAATASVTVLNRLPEVNITVPSGDHSSLEVLMFSASGRDMDGVVANYSWDMGDGTLRHGMNVSHAYLSPGNYIVTVTCRDDSGGESSNSTCLVVLNLLPRAGIGMEAGEHPLELVFTALADDDDGDIASYNWSFGDGEYGEGAMVRHRYVQEGTYDVTLSVTDDAGGVAEAEGSATVLPGNLYLSGMRLNYVRGTGWELSGEVWNEGEVPVTVTLSVDAGGKLFLWEIEVGGGEFEPFDLPLTGFDEGAVNAILLAPEGWETDMEDNLWTAEAEPQTQYVYWIAGGAAIVIAAAAVAMYMRRRR